jgi:hypothetical protein
MSGSKAMRSAFGLKPSTAIRYSIACGGRLMKSRASAPVMTFISSAASRTERVIGPATRPR